MESTRQVKFRVFSGPNLAVPFAAVVAEFPVLYANALPVAAVLQLANDLFPADARPAWKIDGAEVTLPALSAAFSVSWNDLRGPNDLPLQLDRLAEGRWQIALGYYEVDATLNALQLGIELANAIFTRASGAVINTARLQALAQRMRALAGTEQPDSITRALIRVARSKDVPVYSFAPGTRIWMYGQGAKAFRFFQSISEHESFLGVRLVRDKVLTDRVIHRLGLPGVEFGVSETAEMARNIAHRLGYPVVVKPSDRDKGVGITLAIDADTELDAAFAQAKEQSRNGVVIVERHYHGDHHRLSVFGGKFKRATQIRAAHVIGDGTRTVEELIAAENATRTAAEVEAGFVIRLTVDTEMLNYLAKQGYGLSDRPPSGTKLQLRKTSNIATGGKLRDVSAHIHPDNIAMAETIARNFWLDAAGIDFVTPDISVSWRDIPCAIVEVNSPPGITSEFLAEKALSEKFPPGENGRIPCVLIVEGNEALQLAVTERFAANGLRVGSTDGKATSLGGERRHMGSADLPLRVMSLLLDPACDALVARATVAELERHGIPHVRFNTALIAAADEIPLRLRELIAAQVGDVLNLDSEANFGPEHAIRLTAGMGRQQAV
jgi:cyanophycin synthetase